MTRERVARRRASRARSGQALVEFALIVPLFLLLLLGLLEFGFIFDHAMTVSYATREGARSGAAYASGNATTMVCTTSQDVDKNIVAAVQRILKAPGSAVSVNRITEIRIYKALVERHPGHDQGQRLDLQRGWRSGGRRRASRLRPGRRRLERLYPQQRHQPGLDRRVRSATSTRSSPRSRR